MKLTSQQIYWAAGFLEGEGWFGVQKKGTGYARITVAQVQMEPLLRLQQYFGGFITMSRKPQSEKHNQAHQWSVAGIKAAGLMMTIYSLMSPKRQNGIEKTLAAWRAARTNNKQKSVCIRGHPLPPQRENVPPRRVCRICANTRTKAWRAKQINSQP